MPDILHQSITDPNIHETKGASTATLDTALVSNGDGTTTFKKIQSTSIDATSVKNINKDVFVVSVQNTGVAFDVYVPVPFACTITKVTAANDAIITGASSVINILRDSTTLGTLTWAVSSPVGDRRSLTGSFAFSSAENLRISSAATGVTSTSRMHFFVELTRT